MSVIITGHSDDLIEIDGDIGEEFQAYGDINYLAFSNGVLLTVAYTAPGIWRINRLAGSGTIITRHSFDDEGYTDIAEVTGDIKWVLHGTQIVGK